MLEINNILSTYVMNNELQLSQKIKWNTNRKKKEKRKKKKNHKEKSHYTCISNDVHVNLKVIDHTVYLHVN